MNAVVYLYGFVPAAAEPPPAAFTGVAERAVQLLDVADFQVAISYVPADAYAGEAVEVRLQDLGWVGEQGLAHERVVAWFVDHGHIVPAPLLTLYSSADALTTAAWSRAAEISSQLRRFEGMREWDLKVAYRAPDLARHAGQLSAEIRTLDEQIAEATPGRRFLLEKKRSDLVRNAIGDLARERATGFMEEVRRHAADLVVLPIPRATHELPVVLHAALLVRAAEELRLADEVARRAADLDGIGMSVQFSGPWAPYRFLERNDR